MGSKIIRSICFAFVILLAVVAFAASPTLPELFQRGKAEFKGGDYRASLATFDELDAASRLPGNETDRAKLASIILFYRGVNLAALGQRDEATVALRTYLNDNPGAQISAKDYPKKVVDLFEELRTLASKAAPNALAAAYGSFAGEAAALPVDEKWADGPVRYYMSKDELASWKGLTDAASRQSFVEEFWRRHDPTPGTPENELRRDYERRLRFAEVQFKGKATPAGLSDRALVFAILGPPSLAGRAELRPDDDAMESMRGVTMWSRPLGSEMEHGSREVWTYRRDRLPREVGYQDVVFEFVTREGYGEGVLKRDHRAMTTLGAAAKAATQR